MLRSTNPATGEIIADHAALTAPQLEAKVAKAAATWAQWRSSRIETRTALLAAIADQFDTHAERLAAMATAEMGKTLVAARAEVAKCAAAFRYYAQNGAALLAPLAIEGTKATVHYRPLGPILAVMPWNFPYWQVVRFMAPTILAGNVGLLKHASVVQGCGQLLEEMAISAGAPDGLFQNLGIKSDAVAALIADPHIAAVTLTGSEGAGRSVATAAGAALKKVVLELGGSDPFIVMPSANLDAAVAGAVTGRVQNNGQSCVCAKRMIVHADIYDTFAARFTAAMQAVTLGDPTDPANVMGPLSSIEQRDTLMAQLAEAKAAGATLVGGDLVEGKGAYVTAGVITDLPRESDLARQELFGPIAMLFCAADLDDAIAIANDIPFGLGSSVWTSDEPEKARFIADLEAGMIAINQVLASTPEAPFGGIKTSGHGRELGEWGLREFMNVKTVMG